LLPVAEIPLDSSAIASTSVAAMIAAATDDDGAASICRVGDVEYVECSTRRPFSFQISTSSSSATSSHTIDARKRRTVRFPVAISRKLPRPLDRSAVDRFA
jgi:hypothetical protein